MAGDGAVSRPLVWLRGETDMTTINELYDQWKYAEQRAADAQTEDKKALWIKRRDQRRLTLDAARRAG